MQKRITITSRTRLSAMTAARCQAISAANHASAFSIDSSNSELSMSSDTTVRYSQGWRVSSRDKTLARSNNGAFAERNELYGRTSNIGAYRSLGNLHDGDIQILTYQTAFWLGVSV